MTATCTPHSACIVPAAQLSLATRAARWISVRWGWQTGWWARLYTERDAKNGSNKPFAHVDAQWQSALKSLEELDESTLKDIGAPPWVISEIDRNHQSALRRALRIPHI